jgi:hypothetical protein
MKTCNEITKAMPAAGTPNALQHAENTRWFYAKKWGMGSLSGRFSNVEFTEKAIRQRLHSFRYSEASLR